MSTAYESWCKARRNTQEAIGWNQLPNGPKYMAGDTFAISKSHSAIKLTRCGQQSHGGKNYWESPGELNDALLTVIIRRREELLAEAIDELARRENEALVACQGFVSAMQEAIDAAKEPETAEA